MRALTVCVFESLHGCISCRIAQHLSALQQREGKRTHYYNTFDHLTPKESLEDTLSQRRIQIVLVCTVPRVVYSSGDLSLGRFG